MDLHPIEVVAHSLLGNGLDSLNDNFELLGKLQLILLTRLNMIDERLASVGDEVGEGMGDRVGEISARVKSLRKRLQAAMKVLGKVEGRLDEIEGK